MRRPATKVLIVGHPLVAAPLMLSAGVTLLAGFKTGNVFPVLMAGAIIAGVQKARSQANAYRVWKAEWDGMGEAPDRRTLTAGRFFGAILVAAIALAVFAMPLEIAHLVGYALGWLSTQHWLLAALGLIGVGVLVQFVRCFPRRTKPARPVTVIAKPILPVPTLADAYRALPPYCHALLRGQA